MVQQTERCHRCERLVPLDEVNTHTKVCEMWFCWTCKDRMPKKHRKQHLQGCGSLATTCSRCRTRVPRTQYALTSETAPCGFVDHVKQAWRRRTPRSIRRHVDCHPQRHAPSVEQMSLVPITRRITESARCGVADARVVRRSCLLEISLCIFFHGR